MCNGMDSSAYRADSRQSCPNVQFRPPHRHRVWTTAAVVIVWIGLAAPAQAEDEDFTVIDLIVNVLKPIKEEHASDEMIDAGIAEANKLLKQAKIQLKRKGLVNRDVSDGGKGAYKDDGDTQERERNPLRDKGEQEVKDKVGEGKGYKIYIAQDCKPEHAGTQGLTTHHIPVSICELAKRFDGEYDPERTGKVFAHEICHALTLTGHVKDEKNIMDEAGRGNELTPDQIEEIRKGVEELGRTKRKDAPSQPPVPKQHRRAVALDPESGTDDEPSGIPAYNDLRKAALFQSSFSQLALGSIQLHGLFDHNIPIQSRFHMFIDADDNPDTGDSVVVQDKQLGADTVIEVRLTAPPGEPIDASGRLIDAASGQSFDLASVGVVTQDEISDSFSEDDPPQATPCLDEIEFTFDPALLPALLTPLPIGVQCIDPISGTTDEALATMLDNPPPGPQPTLALSAYAARPGDVIQVSGESYVPDSEIQVSFDDALAGTTTSNSSGAFKIDVTVPAGIDDFAFVTGTDSAGGTDFSVLHILASRGDSNGDGSVDFDDIDCFVAALIGKAEWVACSGLDEIRFVELNDINGDESVDFGDIDGFVDCLVHGC